MVKSYVANDESCVYLKDYMPNCIRLTMNGSSGTICSYVSSIPYQNSNVITGMWLRKSDIQALGTYLFELAIIPRPSGSAIFHGGLTINNLLTKGYSITDSKGWKVSVKEDYNGWVYVVSEIPASVFPGGTTSFANYYFRVSNANVALSSNVDVLGLACIQGQSVISLDTIYYDTSDINNKQLTLKGVYKSVANKVDNNYSAISDNLSIADLNKNAFVQNYATSTTEITTVKSLVNNDETCVYPKAFVPNIFRYSVNNPASYIATIVPNIPYQGGNIIAGMWLRKSDLQALGTSTFTQALVIGGTQVWYSTIPVSNLLTNGYSFTKTSIGWKVSVKSEYNGWVFVVSEIPASAVPGGTITFNYYAFRIESFPANTVCNLDMIGLSVLQGVTDISFNKIYYPSDSPTNYQSNAISAIKYAGNLNAPTKTWENKDILFLGDSITAMGYWVSVFNGIVKPKSTINVAVGSSTIKDKIGTVLDGNPVSSGADNNVNNTLSNQVQKIVNNNYPAPSAIFIASGVNDDITTTDINYDIETQFTNGTTSYIPISSCDRKTFAGAMRYCVETLLTLYPNTQIFIIPPLQAAEDFKSYTNNIKPKHQIITNLANRLSIPIVDASNECGIYGGWEKYNTVGRDTTDGLHPNNTTGANKIGKYVSRKFMNWFVC
jgi:lysophospholipase L1-like esterase